MLIYLWDSKWDGYWEVSECEMRVKNYTLIIGAPIVQFARELIKMMIMTLTKGARWFAAAMSVLATCVYAEGERPR